MAVTTSNSEKASINPKFNAEQVLLRLLELIRCSETIRDFTPERLSEAMGLEMNFDGPDRYGAGEILMPEWSYGFHMNRASMGGPRFELSFRERGHPDRGPPMTSICQLDFDRFSASLRSMGFDGEPYYAEHGRILYHGFYRPHLRLEIGTWGEANEPTEKIVHACIESIVIR